MESEIKLLFPAQAREQIEKHPMWRMDGHSPKRQFLRSLYYDTSDLALKNEGYLLRTRKIGDKRIQTLKSSDTSLITRGQWEWPISSDTPDLSKLEETPAAHILHVLEGKLEVAFITEVHRTVQMRTIADTTVELALDEGNIRVGHAKDSIHELEIELKQGSLAQLYHLAFELHTDLPMLRISTESKAARGYQLKSGHPAISAKASPTHLSQDILTNCAFQQIIESILQNLLSNQPAAIAGDVEGIHQMRVAIRRLRAALVLFAPILPHKTAKQYEKELKRFGLILGEARDWDVFCVETLSKVGKNLSSLVKAAQIERETAHQRLDLEFGGPSLTKLVLGLMIWTEDMQQSDLKEMQKPLSDTAPKLLNRIARKLEVDVIKCSLTRLHEIRKSLKKLHYSADWVGDIYSKRSVEKYLKQCKQLQDGLGKLNDTTVALEFTKHLCGKYGEATKAIKNWGKREERKARGKLPQAWKKFGKTPQFWQ